MDKEFESNSPTRVGFSGFDYSSIFPINLFWFTTKSGTVVSDK
jgi:hypothetical protein